MKRVAMDSLPSTLGIDRFEVIPEFPYPGGRTDLVFVNVSDSYLDRRVNQLGLDTPITDRKHLIAFLNIHGRGEITEEYYFSLGPMARDDKRDALDWLMDEGFIIETADGKIRTTPKIRRHITSTYAVELKLNNWRKALQQAAGGRAFAEYKYVVIDADHIDPATSNLDEFRENNIGLISLSPSGDSRVHYDPNRGSPYSTVKRWQINESTIAETEA